jgi:hypothetical protein
LRVARLVRAASFDPPPVFIVGHWRSGTTFLHNLMSRDPAFCFPSIVDVLRPFDFYPNPLEFISRRIILRVLPQVRPMDGVRLDAQSPQEEEIALAAMGAASFFNCFYFPQQMTKVFAEEVLLADGEHERAWREALSYFLAKLAALHPGRRLLLKNPANSARITQLRALFPGAKFIHIHRHPLEVFHSTRRLYRSMLPLLALQDYSSVDLDNHILWTYPELMSRLLDALDGLPSGHATAVRYDQLAADPVGTVAGIYRDLNLGDFGRVQPALERYVAEQPRPTSARRTLDDHTSSQLVSRWGPVYTRLGYPLLAPCDDR